MWTANTEMYLTPEIDSIAELERRIDANESLPASVLYCYACIKEQVLYLNGSPQNTFHPAIIELAKQEGGLIAGNDFKSG